MTISSLPTPAVITRAYAAECQECHALAFDVTETADSATVATGGEVYIGAEYAQSIVSAHMTGKGYECNGEPELSYETLALLGF